MSEFGFDRNACSQDLLHIVATGNSILAELFRLKDCIPDLYQLPTGGSQENYADILLDFSYFEKAEAQEKLIEDKPELRSLDDEIRNAYQELLNRFYLVFESSYLYSSDLKNFIEDLDKGYYIEHTVEGVLQDDDGKQLMCEALYLLGVILLLLDFYVPGPIRERLLISYYRFSGARKLRDSNINEVCTLLRSTSSATFTNSKGSISNYPEAFFARFSMNETFVNMVIARLRCDDIYNQLTIYPDADHRSTALSNQAAMLFVCLYFSPKILHSHEAQMREIVDKFFSDNWVVSIYMGVTVNLIEVWDQFKAAKAALMPVLDMSAIKSYCGIQRDKMAKTLKQTSKILRGGVLTDKFVLQNIFKIMKLLRECNVLLRWFSIHCSSAVLQIPGTQNSTQKAVQFQQLLCKELQFQRNDLFELLLNCSQLELVIRDILRSLLQERDQRWKNFKNEVVDRMNELSEAFSGSRPLAKIEKNLKLKTWFLELKSEIIKLDIEQSNVSGRTLMQLIQALEEVQEFHNLQANMQIQQYLVEAQEFLRQMIQINNVKEGIFINMQLISDFSYSWWLIERDFTTIMQETIKRQPRSVIRLRSVFLKLSSALEIPLLRINQAKSEDLDSVSKYYSTELANYMRKVLQIIPETIFSILARIINLQTNMLKELPTRLEKEQLKEYAQFENRNAISKLTHSIATFTEGVTMMKKLFVGIFELDSKQLLEDGIRKELMHNLTSVLNVSLIFGVPNKTKNRVAELDSKLVTLAKTMDGYRRSFEYIQDYLNVHGLKILQEEFARIINNNVEEERAVFLRNKMRDWQAQQRSVTLSLPIFSNVQVDKCTSNFIGRLANELLQCINPKQTIYINLQLTWCEKAIPHKEVLTIRSFSKIREAIGPVGLIGLDRLYTHMLVTEMKLNFEKILKNVTNNKMWLDMLNTLSAELNTGHIPALFASSPIKYYASYHSRWLKLWPTILDWVLELGQKQLLRQSLAFELSRSSKCNSKNSETALDTLNRTLLAEFKHMEKQNCNREAASIDNFLFELNKYFVFYGSYEPTEQKFITTKHFNHVSLFLSLLTIAHLPRLLFHTNINHLITKITKDAFDSWPFMLGIFTVLQQFDNEVNLLYVSYLCQYVSFLTEAQVSSKVDLNVEITTAIHFLENFASISKLPRRALTNRIPVTILNQIF